MIRQLSIGARASAAFGLIGILTLILGIFALNRMGAIETQLNIISEEQVPSVDNVNDLDREFLRVRANSANVASYVNDPERLERYTKNLNDSIADLKRNQSEYKKTLDDPQARKLFEQYMALDEEYWKLHNQFEKLVNAGLTDAIASIRENSILPLTNKISTKLDELLNREMALIDEASEEAKTVADTAKIM
ncbi:MAG: MCP four helix bundle domain-containing protein, partial [Idiomarina sp.]|nr:MCP four helix bundle domain-containing protein [Idiomarina sp.]